MLRYGRLIGISRVTASTDRGPPQSWRRISTRRASPSGGKMVSWSDVSRSRVFLPGRRAEKAVAFDDFGHLGGVFTPTPSPFEIEKIAFLTGSRCYKRVEASLMLRAPTLSPLLLLVAAAALLLIGCATTTAAKSSQLASKQSKALYNSQPMGLVGLMQMNPEAGPPRAAGMSGLIVGYVVSHPALPSYLWVRGSRGTDWLPVLAFKMSFLLVKAEGAEAGLENIRGQGFIDVYFGASGFSDSLLHYAGSFEDSQRVERDRVEFYGNVNADTCRFYLHLQETALETWTFAYAGRNWRTPPSRIAWDLLVGEFSEGFVGVAFSSNNAMAPRSPEEKLIAIVGEPHRLMRY